MPLRAEPSHRAEQVSQVLFGERLEVLAKDKNGWLQVRCEWDEYEGWVKEGQVTCILYKEYRKALSYYSSSPNDVIQVEYGQFLLSPGSSLFHLKQRKMTWAKREFDFRGKKLAIKLASTTEANINALSKLFMGAPYQWGGRSLMGMDCSGLTQVVFKLMHIRIPRDASQQAEIGETVSFLQEAKCGDLAFFDNADGRITHVGILLNDHTIIHATETSGCVVIDPIDNGGIISRQLRMRTHNLRLVKRIL
jgi:cell wall-associated NlpC family hydrolase